MIVGVDEVGRGPWAGPLVVGAVILGAQIDGLTDSKKLSKKKREQLYSEIMQKSAAVGIGWVTATELDEVGLAEALRLACRRAIMEVQAQKVAFHEIIIDGTQNLLRDTALESYVTTMKKADLLVPSVSAASIVAKVARDEYMMLQDNVYPEYGFASHVGYGTATHKAAIDKHGVTTLHRKSFGPIKEMKQYRLDDGLNTHKNKPSPTDRGNSGENAACTWLESKGYVIIERNWKIKLCEIDIVAKKGEVLYFVEVKHRRNNSSGGGIAAITSKKQRQMRFAATMYIHWHNLYGIAAKLATISTSGDSPKVETYLELE